MRRRQVIPHIREFLADTLTPLAVYQRLSAMGRSRFLFESVTGGEQVSRFSFLGVAPRVSYAFSAVEVREKRNGEERILPGAPLQVMEELFEGYRAPRSEIPFTGGFVGSFGWDFIRYIEALPSSNRDPYDLPVVFLGRYDTVVAIDHARQRVIAVANEVEGEVTAAEAQADLEAIEAHLISPDEGAGAAALPSAWTPRPPTVDASLSGADYRAAVERAKDYIRAGDIFQVVLARRFSIPERVEPLALYRALRMVNPSPYMVLMETEEVSIVGASPEMLVRLEGDRVVTRPIAGTRPRGGNLEEDRLLAQDLLADPKECAEHVMLVDLGRNDIGRVARPETVKVESFMEVERYSHVMHIVSQVSGELEERLSALDALKATFPAGTVSGAPKVRAMEIIDELETESRGPYAGAVGYVSYTGDVDTCIALRTLVVEKDRTSVTAGAGIVADSDPRSEEKETENKAAGMLAAIGLARELAKDKGEVA